MNEFLVIALLSFLVSVVSGVLGLGGAIILIPAYLYIPILFGIDSLDVKTISGITSIQVLSTSILGMIVHRKKGSVNKKLLLYIGIPMMSTALVGALVSGFIDEHYILLSFALMAAFGGILMLKNTNKIEPDINAGDLSFNKKLALISAVLVGFFGGMVGAPGAFLLAPIMITVLKIPIRITIGSTLGIVLFTALTASIGKTISGQVNFLLALYAIIGSSAGVIIGSNLSYKVNPKILRLSLAAIIIGIAIEMVIKVLL